MSVEALAIALHHSKAKGTTRLVLIGIANHDGDGGSWPAVDTLATYAGGVDRRTVQRAIDELERLGEVRRIVQGGGTHATADHRRPNLYEFRLVCPPDCDRSKHHRTRRGGPAPRLDVELVEGEYRLQGAAPTPPQLSTGAAPTPPVGAAPTPPEPSSEPTTKNPVGKPAIGRARVCELSESGEHVISPKYRVCAYCGERGSKRA